MIKINFAWLFLLYYFLPLNRWLYKSKVTCLLCTVVCEMRNSDFKKFTFSLAVLHRIFSLYLRLFCQRKYPKNLGSVHWFLLFGHYRNVVFVKFFLYFVIIGNSFYFYRNIKRSFRWILSVCRCQNTYIRKSVICLLFQDNSPLLF